MKTSVTLPSYPTTATPDHRRDRSGLGALRNDSWMIREMVQRVLELLASAKDW